MVSFVDSMGALEAGLDYGGLEKEFLEEVRLTRGRQRCPCTLPATAVCFHPS
jgi:hypothetical protein